MTDDPGVVDPTTGEPIDTPTEGDGAPERPAAPAAGADASSAAHARSVLEYLVKSVVDDPHGVRVELTEGRRHDISLDVRVSDGDMGRVIGKRGRVAQSIRTVVRAAAVRDDVTVDIEFLE